MEEVKKEKVELSCCDCTIIFLGLAFFGFLYCCMGFYVFGLAGEFPNSDACVNHNFVTHTPEWIDHKLITCGWGGFKTRFNMYFAGYFIWLWRLPGKVF